MVSKESRAKIREKKHYRMRNRFAGTTERPRLAVFRSNNHMYAQIIDDEAGKTLVSSSTMIKDVDVSGKNKTEAAKAVGMDIAAKALKAGLTTVVFDRGGYLYTGRVKALADGAREAGLRF